MKEAVFTVDLRDPARLRVVLDTYLVLKVCPVEADALPRLLFPATVEIRLPDGSRMARWGTVIRHTGRRSFLVQFDGPLDLATLDTMARGPTHGGDHVEASQKKARPEPPARRRDPAPPPSPEPEGIWEPQDILAGGAGSRIPVSRPVDAPPRVAATAPDPPRVAAPVPPVAPPPASPPPPPPEAPPVPPVFVAGPGTGDMVVEQEELVSFDRDRTTRHELEGIHPVAEESGEGLSIDAFGESTRGTGPVPGFMDEDGVPAGWGNTGELEELPKDVSGGPDPGDRATDSPELAAVYRHLESLGTSEKQRLAKGGNRTVRGLLVKDRMKNLHQFVFRNPKITLEEVMEYARLPGLSKEAIRIIASDRTWMASLQVVLALVRNPGTPTELLSGLIQRLGPAHWRVLARSGDVRSQVATLAKKLLLASGS